MNGSPFRCYGQSSSVVGTPARPTTVHHGRADRKINPQGWGRTSELPISRNLFGRESQEGRPKPAESMNARLFR